MWRSPIYAIVRSGGKQFRVQPTQTFDVERLKADVGSTVDLGVLLLSGNGETQVGTPLVDGARVVAEVVEHGRGKKVTVFKYKNKTRYRRKKGHRQEFTRLSVKEIVTAAGTYTDAEPASTPKRIRRSHASLAEPEAVATPDVEAEATAPVEAAEAPEAEATTAVEEAPKRATRARKPAAPKAEGAAPKRTARTRKPKAEPEAEAPAAAAEPEESEGE